MNQVTLDGGVVEREVCHTSDGCYQSETLQCPINGTVISLSLSLALLLATRCENCVLSIDINALF